MYFSVYRERQLTALCQLRGKIHREDGNAQGLKTVRDHPDFAAGAPPGDRADDCRHAGDNSALGLSRYGSASDHACAHRRGTRRGVYSPARFQPAAKKASDKIAASLPEPLSKTLSANALHAWGSIAPAPAGLDLSTVRRAVRDEETLEIIYRDEAGAETRRRVRPIAVIYYSETVNIVAWCELRQAIRNFRSDRVQSCQATGSFFKLEGEKLRQLWMAGWQSNQPAIPYSQP